MRFPVLLLAALGAAVTAVPLEADAPTPADAAIVPRATPTAEYVSPRKRNYCNRPLISLLTMSTCVLDCLYHRLHEGMRHQLAPMHDQMRPVLLRAVSPDAIGMDFMVWDGQMEEGKKIFVQGWLCRGCTALHLIFKRPTRNQHHHRAAASEESRTLDLGF